MAWSDRELGMDRAITRRDFLNGVSIAVGGAVLAPTVTRAEGAPQQAAAGSSEYYPPALTGMRGSHPGSFEVAHDMWKGKTWDSPEDTRETYDVVVVGAGMSGLAAAYFFRKESQTNRRILILDNHDDFGGHAKRNEFTVDGRLLIRAGGTAYITKPWTYTAEGRALLEEIGVDYYAPSYKRETDFYDTLGLRGATYFDRESYGVDRLVIGNAPPLSVGGGASGAAPAPEFLAKTPLPEHVRQDLLRLYSDKRDYLAGLSVDEKINKLQRTSYQDYLLNTVKVHPDVLQYFHPDGPAGLTTDTTSAWYFYNRHLPGFAGLGVPLSPNAPTELDRTRPNPNEPIAFYFPEGNAGVARLLVRSLIPEALPGRTMEDAQLTRVRYARLDEPASPVRLRLNSTVVRVRNVGDPATATEADVTYVREGKAYRVRAKGVVLACYNAVIPHLCPELSEAQKDALRLAVRGVNMSTGVAVRNWTAFEKLGVSTITCPGLSYPGYSRVSLRTPVSLGAYQAPRRPTDPTVVDLRGGVARLPGKPPREQFRAAREVLYQTTFEEFERRIRTDLLRLLGDGGFDPARDVTAITINRWPHGYAMGENMFDPEWTGEERPWVRARKQFGRITIANSDAGAIHLTSCAFDQAHRAVDELNPRHMGWWQRF